MAQVLRFNDVRRHSLDGGADINIVTVQQFRSELVVKAHRLCVSLNSRRESNEEEERSEKGAVTPKTLPAIARRSPRPGISIRALRPSIRNKEGTTTPFSVHCPISLQ